jgi:hypothetical protein
MDSTARNRPNRWVYRPLGPCALLLGIAGAAAGITVLPAAAQAASRSEVAVGHTIAGRAARPLASSVCSKVSAASVSAVVGYTLPAPSSSSFNLKASAKTDGVSAIETICVFGSETSTAALSKAVILALEVTSKPLTLGEVEKEIAQSESATSKFKETFTPYSGLGRSAVYFNFSDDGITDQGIAGFNGTNIFVAVVTNKSVSKSKLAALAKLAERL